MKGKILLMVASVVLLMAAAPAFAAKDVLLTHAEAEDTTGNDWGLKISEHATSPSQYGNYASTCSGGDGRLVSDTSEDLELRDSAYYTFTYQGSVRNLVIRHLDGIADDSFEVYAIGNQGQEIPIGSYTDTAPENDPEIWHNTAFSLEPAIPHLGHGHSLTVKIKLTGDHWSGYNQWGQLAIDWMEIYGNGKK